MWSNERLCHSMELLVDLLKSPDLYVMQVEMDVYTLAKRVSWRSLRCLFVFVNIIILLARSEIVIGRPSIHLSSGMDSI